MASPGDVKVTLDGLQVLANDGVVIPLGEGRISNSLIQVLINDGVTAPLGEGRISNSLIQVLATAPLVKILGTVNLSWADPNDVEDGHYIYRSDTPMDPEALPPPLDTLGPDVTTYADYAEFIEGYPLYYRVAAFKGGDIKVSEEIVVTPTSQT